MMKKKSRAQYALIALAFSAIAVAFAGSGLAQQAGNQPADANTDFFPFPPPGQVDRVVVSSSDPAVLEAQFNADGLTNEPVELLSTALFQRSRRDNDLVIRVNGECAALIDSGEDDGEEAQPMDDELVTVVNTSTAVNSVAVTTWVELDGVPVPVDTNFGDDGNVVFCQSKNTADLAALDPDSIIDALEQSRNSNGFTWTLPDVARGFHEVVVKARLDPVVPEGAEEAEVIGFFGKRIMTVDFDRISFE